MKLIGSFRKMMLVCLLACAAFGMAFAQDNIIKNGSFDSADLGPWSASQAGAAITALTADTEIAPGVTTYGSISGRTQTWECFAQDITAAVKPGVEYAFSFYAMLSAEYEGKPAEQRQVDFAPYVVMKDGSTSYLGSYSSEITGTSSARLTPGTWQKFEGTFTIPSGDVDRVVIRIIEQGTNYGSGICVLGEYFLAAMDMHALTKIELAVQDDVPALRDAVAPVLGKNAIVGTSLTGSEIADTKVMDLVTKHFNAVTLGNELKPDALFGYSNARCPGTQTAVLNGEEMTVPVMDFSRAERMLNAIKAWNDANPDRFIKIRGHVLLWHSQTPEWFFHENYDKTQVYVTKDVMNKRLEWYIKSVLEHFLGADSPYKDMFYGWDVVNEAVSDSGGYRKDTENGSDSLTDDTHGSKSSWWHIYQSNEFIINAFKFANKYAPASLELYYNDYNETNPSKVDDICALLQAVKAAEGAPGKGTRISGFGMQGHYNMSTPDSDAFEAAARRYAAIVGSVMLTELDIKASTAYDGTAATRDDEFNKEGVRYYNLYKSMQTLQAEGVNFTGWTVWGVVDKNSWLQSQSNVGGGSNGARRQCPLLFDDDYQVKPAYWAFVDSSKIKVVEHVPQPVPCYEIGKASPRIDGLQGWNWWWAEKVSLDINQGAECSAWAKLLWDDENLYVFVHVDDPCLNSDSADDYQQDSFEIFIDERSDKATTYKDDDKQYRISFENKQSFNGTTCKAENITSVVRLTRSGYNIEAAIKWTEIEPSVGRQIGLELQVNDADESGKRIGTLNWVDTTNDCWENPSCFGYAILAKKSRMTEVMR